MVDGTSINVTSHCDIAVATLLSPQAARIRTNKANRFTFLSPFLKVIEHSVTVACRAAGAAPAPVHPRTCSADAPSETSDCDTRRSHRVQPACPAPWTAHFTQFQREPRIDWRPRPRHLSSPGSGIGNPPADQHLQPRPGGTSRRVPGGLGRERQTGNEQSHRQPSRHAGAGREMAHHPSRRDRQGRAGALPRHLRIDLRGSPQARLEGSLHPPPLPRGVLASEVDAALGRCQFRMLLERRIVKGRRPPQSKAGAPMRSRSRAPPPRSSPGRSRRSDR